MSRNQVPVTRTLFGTCNNSVSAGLKRNRTKLRAAAGSVICFSDEENELPRQGRDEEDEADNVKEEEEEEKEKEEEEKEEEEEEEEDAARD